MRFLWNDRIAQIFIGNAGFIDLRQYRAQHLSHHRFNQTENDHQYARKIGHNIFQFPKAKTEIALTSLRFGLGLGFLQSLRDLLRTWRKKPSYRTFFLRLGVTMALLWGLASLDLLQGFLLFWVVPIFTVFPLLNYWRTVAEHIAIPDANKKTRSLRLNPLLAWLLTPYNINYHGEHHTNPGLPWHALPQGKLDQGEVWVTKGLWSFLRECSTFRKS